MANDKNMRSLDDIIFEDRNKEYGAYRLRNNEKGYLLKAFLIGTTIFVLFVLLLYYYNRWQSQNVRKDKEVKINLENLNTPKEEEKEEIIEIKEETPPPPPPPRQEEGAQIKFVMPEVKKVVQREETIPPAPDTKDQNLGGKTIEGTKPVDPFAAHGKPKDVPPVIPEPPKPKIDENKIYKEVEEDAEYPGGINVLRAYVASNIEYPPDAIEARKDGKVIVKFVVERNGTVSGLTVVSDKLGYGAGKEVIRALNKTKKWKPAKSNGENVRSYYFFTAEFTLP